MKQPYSCLAAFCAALALLGPDLASAPPARAAESAAIVNFRGVVKNAAGEPLSGARVQLPALGRGTMAGMDGTFELKGVPAGRQLIEVRWAGFAPLIREITIDGDQPLELALTPTPFQVPGVTVTATRAPGSPLDSPLPVNELSGPRLRREQGVSLAHSLSTLAGVRDLRTGQEIGKPMIRGLTGARVLVLDNGNRMEDYSWSEEDGPSIDARSADRVEVIRGPASLLYGSDALGGVVNAIPEDLPRTDTGQSLTNVGYEAYFASNNKELGAAVRAEGARGELGWRLFGIGRHSEALSTPDGELENTGFTAVNGEAAIGLHGERHSGVLRVARYGGEFKLLEANGPPPGTVEGEEGGPVRKNNDIRAQLAGNHFLGSWWFETRAQFQTHNLEEVSDEATAAPAPAGRRLAPLAEGNETTAFDLTLNTFTAEIIGHHALGAHGKGTLGVSGLHQDGESDGPIFLVPTSRTNSGGAFALGQVEVGKATLLAGGRIDGRKLETDDNPQLQHAGQSRSWNAGSGDVGVIVRPTGELALSANVGRAWRAPNVFELFTNGPHLGEDRYEIGKATLKAETSLNADVAVRWEHARFRGELAGFRNAINDFIYIIPTDETVGDLRVYRYDQADAILLGGEATAEVAAQEHLNVRGRFDYVRGSKDESGHPPLPLMPPARTALEVEWHADHLGWADKAHLGVEGEWVATQHRRTEFDFPTVGYGLVNVDSGLEHALLGRAFTFDLGVQNLLNKRYKNYLSRYKEFALDPGVNVLFRVSTGL